MTGVQTCALPISKSKDLGIIGIAEIVIALFLQGQIVGEDGKPVPQGEDMLTIFRRAGFGHCYCRRLTFGACTIYIGEK